LRVEKAKRQGQNRPSHLKTKARWVEHYNPLRPMKKDWATQSPGGQHRPLKKSTSPETIQVPRTKKGEKYPATEKNRGDLERLWVRSIPQRRGGRKDSPGKKIGGIITVGSSATPGGAK